MTFVLVPSTAANNAAKAAELKKVFEEGVAAAGREPAAAISRTKASERIPPAIDQKLNFSVAVIVRGAPME